MKTAIVIGATGATGLPLVNQLLAHQGYARVLVFSRRKLDLQHPRLDVRVVDFDKPQKWQAEIKGDELFSAMGTTLKQAGSKAAQYKVDYSYQAEVMEAAANNGVKKCFLVSAPGANSRSLVFYSRIKGELEDFARQLPFEQQVYFRPSFIVGDRAEARPGEKLAIGAFRLLPKQLPFVSRYRPIEGQQLAEAMVSCAQRNDLHGITVVELDKIFELL